MIKNKLPVLSTFQTKTLEYQHLKYKIEKPKRRLGRIVTLSVLFFEKTYLIK